MKKTSVYVIATFAMFSSSGFGAPITDGQVSPGEYGAARASATYLAAAPTSNFDAPTAFTNAISYAIYLDSQNGYLYGAVDASGGTGAGSAGSFANLYFDLDPANSNGSDIGFEIGANGARQFVAGVSGYVAAPGAITAVGNNGLTVEFAIPVADFTGPVAGLDYTDVTQFPSAQNPDVVLRLSQSFGYSVVGGITFGDNRLGRVALDIPSNGTAVPEPISLAILGFGVISSGILRRISKV